MKYLILIILIIISNLQLFSHENQTHQYITIEALKLLEL